MKNQTLKDIMNRRSTRKYKEQQISNEELETLLDSAIQAPSAMNSQPWHFTVVQNKNMIDDINEISKKHMAKDENPYISKLGNSESHIFYNAPTVIIVSGKKTISSALVDCSAAIQNMLIAAESIGLGTVWVGFARWFFESGEKIENLETPEGYESYYAIAIGYKKDSTVIGPGKRNKDIIEYIK